MAAMDGPANDEWWMLTIADPDDTVVFGELVAAPHLGGPHRRDRLHAGPRRLGRGYAAEASTALVEYLFETLGVTRVEGMLHPDNPASAMVLERVGMLFEGHTRSSFWIGDENSDDWLYGMTRPDWEAWRDRPRARPAEVRLVEVTPETQRAVRTLATHKSQERFVSPVVNSFADALFPGEYRDAPVVPWMRAIEADGELAGFVMLGVGHGGEPRAAPVALPDRPDAPAAWHRGQGAGARDRAVPGVGQRDAARVVDPRAGHAGADVPRPRFVPTGVVDEGEIEARLQLGA